MTRAKLFSLLIKPFTGTGIGKIPIVSKIYHRTTPYLIGGRNKIINFGSFKMQVGDYVPDVVTLFIANGKYEPLTTEMFKKILKVGDRVIDIGANIGYFTLLSASIVGKEGKVFAFEPELNNMNELRRNIILNGFNNVDTYRCAVSDYSGISELFLCPNDPAHSLIQTGLHTSSVSVAVGKLDEYITSGEFKLMKVDVEGSEFAVLRGAENLIRRSKDINLIIEISLTTIPKKYLQYLTDLWDYLKSLGMQKFYILNDYTGKISVCSKPIELAQASENPSHYINLLCTR